MRSRLLLVIGLLPAVATAQVSPFTGKSVVPPDSMGGYRLLIGGHFHGSSSDRSGYPSPTLLANLDTINALGANLMLSTGDLFLQPDLDSARYARSFFSRLDLALFNAPGNHDLEGKAYRSGAIMPVRIAMGQDRILLLDTERNNSNIKGDQLDAIVDIAEEVAQGMVRHVFIFSHRPVWSEEEPLYGDLFLNNTRSLTGCNFNKDVLPLLQRMARKAEVFWISGSMAGRAPASIFFQPHEEHITYVQSAIRGELRDALLIADVGRSGIRWSALSLTGLSVEKVERHGVEWWKEHQRSKAPFRWRILPYLIKKNLGYPSFWYGFVVAMVVLILLRAAVRRW